MLKLLGISHNESLSVQLDKQILKSDKMKAKSYAITFDWFKFFAFESSTNTNDYGYTRDYMLIYAIFCVVNL